MIRCIVKGSLPLSILFMVMGLLWNGLAFSSEYDCEELFFQSYQENEIDYVPIRDLLNQKSSSFERFKTFTNYIGKDVYVTRTTPEESTAFSSSFIRDVYTPAKSVVGVAYVVGGSFSLEEASIINKIQELRYTSEGKHNTDVFYYALMAIKDKDQKFYSDIIYFIEEFLDWDPLNFKEDNWLKKDANRDQGLQDPEIETLIYKLNETSGVLDRITDMSKKILKKIRSSKYSKNLYCEDDAMGNALFFVLSYLYYNYYADVYVSFECSGVVLSHNILLTAAKCLYNAAYLQFVHNGKEYNSIKHEINPNYIYDSTRSNIRDTIRDIPSESDMGIAIFPNYTFGDILPAVISFREINDGEELISSACRLTEGVAKISFLKKGTVNFNMLNIADPKPKQLRVGSGEIGGAVFDSNDKLVGSISSLIWSEDNQKPYNMYALTFSDSNKKFLRDMVARYSQIKIEDKY